MKNRWYSKFLAGVGIGVILLTLLVNSAKAAVGDTTRVSLALDSTSGRIVFSSNRDGNSGIYVMKGDGTGQTRLTYDSWGDYSPVWSPDGNKIAYSPCPSGCGINIMNSDGSGQIQLLNSSDTDGGGWF